MKTFRSALWLLLLAVSSFAQTHTEMTLEDAQNATGAKTFGQLNGRIINASACASSPIPSWCSGSDLGAWIKAAVTQLGSPGVIWASPGTISTAPDLPRGYTLEFMPGVYTLSVDWPIYHRNTRFRFNGAVFNYTKDAGTFAFQVGKASAYTAMNCSVTNGSPTVTWVSGGLGSFSDIDAGDTLYALNQAANILSISGNTITLTANWSGATNANTSCVGYLSPDTVVDTNFASITFDDLLVNYSGAGTNAANGIFQFKAMSTPLLRNVRVGNFNNGTAYSYLGTITSDNYSVSCGNVKNCQVLDSVVLGGYTFPSNNNIFWRLRASQYDGTHGNACNQVLVKSNSTGNSWYGSDIEYNQCTEVVRIQDTAVGNGFYAGCRFEGNGDATANSRDIRIAGTAANTIINNCYHTSGVTNNPNTGIQIDATTTGTSIENERFNVAAGTPYATCYNFVAGANGRSINVGCPTTNVDPSGTNGSVETQGNVYTINQLQVNSAAATALNAPNGGINAGGYIQSSSGLKPAGGGSQSAITGDGTNVVIPATTKLLGLVNAAGLQFFNTTTTCTTGATVGATCTTAAITLPAGEADTSYRISCTGKGLTNVPSVIATTNSSATQFTITIAALTAAAASFTSYDCVVGHN